MAAGNREILVYAITDNHLNDQLVFAPANYRFRSCVCVCVRSMGNDMCLDQPLGVSKQPKVKRASSHLMVFYKPNIRTNSKVKF